MPHGNIDFRVVCVLAKKAIAGYGAGLTIEQGVALARSECEPVRAGKRAAVRRSGEDGAWRVGRIGVSAGGGLFLLIEGRAWKVERRRNRGGLSMGLGHAEERA